MSKCELQQPAGFVSNREFIELYGLPELGDFEKYKIAFCETLEYSIEKVCRKEEIEKDIELVDNRIEELKTKISKLEKRKRALQNFKERSVRFE